MIMAKWEYKEFSDYFGYTEQWLDFLNQKGLDGWELISYTEEPYIWDKSKSYRKCLFKRKIED